MKIGIIGLRPRQISDMQKRKLVGDFVYHNEKYLSPASTLSFVRDKDLVFVQNSGMPKSCIQAIPRGPDVFFNINKGGSISSLLQLVEETFKERGMVLYEEGAEPTPETAPAPTPKRKVETLTTDKPIVKATDKKVGKLVAPATLGDLLVGVLASKKQQLTSVVPEGRTSEYKAPEAELYVYDGSTTPLIETRLARCSIGEIVRFSYDPKADAFSARLVTVQNVVAYLNRKHGVDVEAHLYQDYVDFQVMTAFETALPKVEEAPKPVALKTPAPEMPPAVVEQSIASDVPEGRRSQYLLPKHDIVINYPNSGGVQNYSILQAALPGDVVRFARPEGLSLASWRSRIGSMRHYQWRYKGILLEAHFYNEYVDIKVMHIDESQVPANTDNWTIKERAEPVNEPRDMGQRQIFAVAEDGLPAVRDGDSSVDKGVVVEAHAGVEEVAPANVEVVPTAEAIDDRVDLSQVPNPDAEVEALGESGNIADKGMSDLSDPAVEESELSFGDAPKAERKFWRIIFLAEFDVSGDVDVATAKADAALKIHRKRFS